MRISSFVSKLASGGNIPLNLVSFVTTDGQDFWCMIFAPKAKLRELQGNIGSDIKLSSYGKIIYSGFGKQPPEYLLQKVSEEYKVKISDDATI